MKSRINDIFRECLKVKAQKTVRIDDMKSDLGALAEKIVLYGAGSAGIAFLHYLKDVGISPKFFSDGNPKRWGQYCEGLEIIDFHKIPEKIGEDALVIITINTDGIKYCKSFDEALRAGGHVGVHKSLHDAGCKNIIDYTYFRRCSELFRGDRYNLPSCSDVYEMEEHEEDICRAYELLSDDKSKEIFEKIVRFRLIDDTLRISTEPQDKQYFEYEFFSKRNDEVFVDCGAYNGISLKTFLAENHGEFKRYYGIEPDNSNFEKLSGYINSLSEDIKAKTVLINKCAYEDDRELKLYALDGPGSFIADIGTQSTKGVCIDEVTGEIGATFIKMNIEGTEIPALKGAKKTIYEFKPRLAIAGYHKTADLWKVPLLINSFRNDYEFHLRSYMNHISFIYYMV